MEDVEFVTSSVFSLIYLTENAISGWKDAVKVEIFVT